MTKHRNALAIEHVPEDDMGHGAEVFSADEIVSANIANPDVHAANGRAKHFAQAQEKQEAEEAKFLPTPAEMAGADGSPIERVHDMTEAKIVFYPRSPRITAMDAMQEQLNALQGEGAKQGSAVIRMATNYLYVAGEDGKRRQATFDEVDGCFTLGDVPLLTLLSQKYLNIKMQTGAPSPNA